ncbi:MAG: cysteine synthase A [Candidatus Aenigmatarchaeota archaeon]
MENLIGNTPIVKIRYKKTQVFAKMENLNPSGSIKDRIAKYILDHAESSGKLKRGMTIVEPTSGNTGISFSFLSSIRGYKFIAVMPEFASKERIRIIKQYGGKVILTPEKMGMAGAVNKAKEIAKKMKAFLPNQFENEYNIIAHQETTGREILRQVSKIDYFVAGVGTGGTLIGVAKVLKDSGAKIIAVEPKESPLLSKGFSGLHKIEGIGEDFVPKIVQENSHLIDRVISVSSNNAIKMTKKLNRNGLFVGISSGANVFASFKIAKKSRNKRVVTILPDSADRYYSTEVFE